MRDVQGATITRGDTVRVLHLDDDTAFTDVTAAFLTAVDEAFAVDTVASVSEALDMLATTPYDCVVSDYDMPEQNGLDFLEAVRADAPDLPFILFTGKGSEKLASEAISAGVTDYLQKQSGTEQYELLANRIRNVVEASRSTAALAERNRKLETLIGNLPGVVYRCKNEPSWPEEVIEGEVEELTGYTAEALESSDVTWGEDIIHPDDRDATWEAVQEELPSDAPFEFTYRIVTREGTVKWVWERGRGVYDDDELVALEGFITDITDRKTREEALERTSSLLSTLFETLPVGVLAEDSSREVLSVNARMFELFDLPGDPDDVVGADCAALATEVSEAFESPDEFVDRIASIVDDRESIRDEEVRFTDGRTLARSYEPLDLPDGTGHLWLYRDVTPQKRHERTLQQHELLLQNSPDAFYVIDEEGTITYQSHDPEQLAETPRRNLEGRSATPFIHPEDREQVVADFEYLLENPDETVTSEYRFEAPTGEWRWYENRAINRLDDPAIEGLIVVNRDITTRKQREQRVRQFQERLEELIRASTREEIADIAIDTAQDVFDLPLSGVHLVNEDRTVLEPVAVTDEVADLFDVLPRYDRDQPSRGTDTINWEFFEAGERVVIEDSHEDDRIDAAATPSRSGVIHPLGDHGLFITTSPEPREFDEEDVTLTEILSTVVTAALDQVEQERTLRERSQQLQEETERLDEFASIVSHDLRTPLSVASGRLHLAHQTEDLSHLDEVQRSLEEMEELIDHLLLLAREGTQAMKQEVVDLPTVATRVGQRLSDDDATVRVETELCFEADQTRLEQLLTNLMGNAVEHGGPAVTVTIGDLDDGSGFFVADDGPGIPPDMRETVFESGYSSDAGGTGFGLRIVSQVAKTHGWTVSLTESETGGARFEIRGVTPVTE